MSSSPVWKVRRKYESVVRNDDELIAQGRNRPGSGTSDDTSISSATALTDYGDPILEKNQARNAANNNCVDSVLNRRLERKLKKLPRDDFDNTRVIINISGSRFETHESTLARVPDSLLGSPSKRTPHYDPTKNEFYISTDRSVFDSILFYYQSGGSTGGILVKPDGIADGKFLEEVKFFELGEDAEGKLGYNVESRDGLLESLPRAGCSSKIRQLFDSSKTTKASSLHKVVDVWTILITIFFIILLCGKTSPSLKEAFVSEQCCDQNKTEALLRRREIKLFWSFSEKFCISWFTLEYALRAFSATSRMAYLISAQGIFDMLSFAPHLMMLVIQGLASDTSTIPLQRVLLFVTFFSLFKLTRYSLGLQVFLKTIKASLKELMLLLVCVAISLVLFSSMIYYCESTVSATSFTSIPATFWFTIVTMTTVGYGDITPVTVAGKVFSALCAVFGVCCVLAIPSTVIVTNFNFFYLKHKELAKPKKPNRPKSRMTVLQKWVTRFRSVSM
ncbi:shaker-related potassium channel tsha2-like [Stylophora pistillata]|uniref:shaker-related potassium channel tsha2-like n=1 Tax=Stylophora pistillata TaxID=50429 RepID=UPI000C04D221|nr:shaker-related potassium channel tsha2-like [Stylophora pistillata]